MTINASEARKTTDELNQESTAKIIGEIDSKIDQAIYAGEYNVTTKILSHKMQEAVKAHYSEYEYEVVDYNNNMLGINW